MYLSDSREQLKECDLEREYFVSADVYISNAAGAFLRKYKKQGEEQRLKDKSSWLGLGKGPAASGIWRPAICKLSKEANSHRCFLNIYVDESILFQTIYVHLLHQTDVRPADNSLFFRKDCVAIYSANSQRWVDGNNPEPIYLQFSKPALHNLWISLLRSYAVPEIYGRWLSRSNPEGTDQEGGSYRMWREVQLTVAQGRNLGTSKVYDPSQNLDDLETEVELKDIDVYCEILLNDVTCGRTTLKKGLGLPEWHETFTFSDIPPFESLEVLIWKEKKVLKPAILGTVIVDLITFRRGELLEGWYPVHSTNISSHLQLGELRLEIRVNEEIILPQTSYMTLQQTLNTRNFMEWMHDFENKMHMKTLSNHLLHLAITQENVIQQIQEAAEWEVEKSITSHAHQTMFRGNTVFTKTMEKCIAWYGNAFLEASIGKVLRRLFHEKIAIEVDPIRSGKGAKDVGRHVDQLIYWCREFWEQIFSVRDRCPKELRALLDRVRTLVERYSRSANLPVQMQQQRPWQSVSAFIFLRFIVPGILHPHLFGLCPGLPNPPIQRSLKLIAKVIQSMANLNTADQKEISMGGIRDFLKDNMPRMMEYLTTVSTPKSSTYSSHKFEDVNDRSVLHSLEQHKATLPILERESIPAFPHYIDPARELAIITSTVVRHSRDTNNKGVARKMDDQSLETLCSKCFEVEEEALQRVNELATRLAQERRRASASAAWINNSARSPTSQSLTSIPTSVTQSKPSLPSTAYASTTTLEVASQATERSRSNRAEASSSNLQVGGYGQGEGIEALPVHDAIAPHLKSTDALTPMDGSDDVARRKKSFMRGIFSSEKGGGGSVKPRH